MLCIDRRNQKVHSAVRIFYLTESVWCNFIYIRIQLWKSGFSFSLQKHFFLLLFDSLLHRGTNLGLTTIIIKISIIIWISVFPVGLIHLIRQIKVNLWDFTCIPALRFIMIQTNIWIVDIHESMLVCTKCKFNIASTYNEFLIKSTDFLNCRLRNCKTGSRYRRNISCYHR